MKYKLTIETDDASEIARLVQCKPLVSMAEACGAPAPVTITNDDDGPVNEQAPDTDARGIPWDERIHAGTKATNKDGSWRYKRGVTEATIKTVEAELTATPAPAPATPAPATVAVPTGDMPELPAALDRRTTAADAPTATYEQVIAMLSEALTTGKMAPGDMPAFWQSIGVAGAHELVGNQTAIDAAYVKITLG